MPILGAVDIGANSVRLKVARQVRSRLEVLQEDREVTRLGESVFRSGALDPGAMAHTVKVLQRFYRTVQTLGAERVRVVATSALRDASNAGAFTQWVYAATGWQVEVISGLEEGRLIHLGVVSNTRIQAGRVLLIDLGGGSCELTVSSHGQIEGIHSLPLGAVRLTRDFLDHDPPKKQELERLRGFIAEEIRRVREPLLAHRINQTVATSGTPAALSEAFGAEAGHPTTTVPRKAVQRLAKRLSSKSLVQRRAVPGIGPRRAEIIIAGAQVFSELLTLLELPSFRYLPFGLRDGLLAEMASEYDTRAGVRRQLLSERANSLQKLAEQYQVDLQYAAHVWEHCARLFQSLQAVHQLPPEYADWLHAAAMLQETGSFVNRAGRRRHTWYIIAHSELFGFTLHQRRIIAAISRYLGKSKPTEGCTPFKTLSPVERVLVHRSILLLRLARALEQGRRGAVQRVRVRIEPSKVRLALISKQPGVELELWAVSRERTLFRVLFGRDLECAEG